MLVDLEQGAQAITKWYSLEPKPRDGDDVGILREIFEDSVRFRLVSDVPVGSCLSGGLDSSSIVCVMRRLSPKHELKTFSAIFPGTRIDESAYARDVVRHAEAQGFFVSPTTDELLRDLPDFVRTQEEPLMGTSAYAQYRVMQLAHENGMKVLLDGQGSDEIFAGYDRYFGGYFEALLRGWRWLTLAREAACYYRYTGKTIPFQVLAYSLLPKSLKAPARRNRFAPWIGRDFYARHVGAGGPEDRLSACRDLNSVLAESVSFSSIPQLLRFEDKNAMRWSVESRVPFLDYRLVEYALSIPPERKIQNGMTKVAFRAAMAGVLPEGVRSRTDKIGFATPEDLWLREPGVQAFLRDVVRSGLFQSRGYWDAVAFSRFFECAVSEGGFAAQYVWKVVFLELWFREFIGGSRGT
jgi:asparagine synthase (glutamine-hydrolysing)